MQMTEYNLINENDQVVKKYGYMCPSCKKIYSEVFLRYEKRNFACSCGTKLENPKR